MVYIRVIGDVGEDNFGFGVCVVAEGLGEELLLLDRVLGNEREDILGNGSVELEGVGESLQLLGLLRSLDVFMGASAWRAGAFQLVGGLLDWGSDRFGGMGVRFVGDRVEFIGTLLVFAEFDGLLLEVAEHLGILLDFLDLILVLLDLVHNHRKFVLCHLGDGCSGIKSCSVWCVWS